MDEHLSSALRSVGAYDAKTRLSELLDRVERGEQIIITRHGRPIARLVPEGEAERTAARAAAQRLVALGNRLAARGVNLSDAEIKSLREDGRR
jgi:prevent-host-death family protein